LVGKWVVTTADERVEQTGLSMAVKTAVKRVDVMAV
jgi:hypothetical protein